MHGRVILTLLFLLPFLAGCLAPAHKDSPQFTFGLGLQVPQQLPAPRPHAEPADEVMELQAFLETNATRIKDDCHNAGATPGWLGQRYDEGHLLSSIRIILDTCSLPDHELGTRMARAATANGTRTRTYGALLGAASSALNETEAVLDSVFHPATVSESEYLAELMGEHLINEHILQTAQNFVKREGIEGASELNLLNSFNNFLLVRGRADAIQRLALEYPWREGSRCAPPDLNRLFQDTAAGYQRILAIGNASTPAEDSTNIGNLHGSTLISTWPTIRTAIDKNWWPVVLAGKSGLAWRDTYWQLHNRGATLPTYEEALYLVAKFRNETRTLSTDGRAAAVADDLVLTEDYYTHDPNMGLQVLSLASTKWAFGAVTCARAASSS
jgi:hypothetical protein